MRLSSCWRRSESGMSWKRFIGDFYMGVDLGKLRDYSALAVVKREKDGLVKLVFVKEFLLETPYTHVIGWIVRADRRFRFRRILIDKSGVGEAVMEEVRGQGLTNAEGKAFTAQSKAEMLAYLRIKMEQGKLKMPYNHRLCQQINSQQYEYAKSGQLKFWHPPHSHDDQLWALALSTWATKTKEQKGIFIKAW